MTDAPSMHPEIAPLAFLLGTWVGAGKGEYPTIDGFSYHERVTFAHVGKPFLVYGQRTWAVDDGRPLHVETGYWRLPWPDRAEIVLAHPTGIAEVQEGTFEATRTGGRFVVRTSATATTASAKKVTALERTFEVDGDVLRYTVAMAAVGQPMTHHLAGELRRDDAP